MKNTNHKNKTKNDNAKNHGIMKTTIVEADTNKVIYSDHAPKELEGRETIIHEVTACEYSSLCGSLFNENKKHLYEDFLENKERYLKDEYFPVNLVLRWMVNITRSSPKCIKSRPRIKNYGIPAVDLIELVREISKKLDNPIYKKNNAEIGRIITKRMRKHYPSLNALKPCYGSRLAKYKINKDNHVEKTESIRVYPRLEYKGIRYFY
jgi:hypothetical protein